MEWVDLDRIEFNDIYTSDMMISLRELETDALRCGEFRKLDRVRKLISSIYTVFLDVPQEHHVETVRNGLLAPLNCMPEEWWGDALEVIKTFVNHGLVKLPDERRIHVKDYLNKLKDFIFLKDTADSHIVNVNSQGVVVTASGLNRLSVRVGDFTSRVVRSKLLDCVRALDYYRRDIELPDDITKFILIPKERLPTLIDEKIGSKELLELIKAQELVRDFKVWRFNTVLNKLEEIKMHEHVVDTTVELVVDGVLVVNTTDTSLVVNNTGPVNLDFKKDYHLVEGLDDVGKSTFIQFRYSDASRKIYIGSRGVCELGKWWRDYITKDKMDLPLEAQRAILEKIQANLMKQMYSPSVLDRGWVSLAAYQSLKPEDAIDYIKEVISSPTFVEPKVIYFISSNKKLKTTRVDCYELADDYEKHRIKRNMYAVIDYLECFTKIPVVRIENNGTLDEFKQLVGELK